MKKLILFVLVCLFIAGCSQPDYPGKLPINDQWKQKYGESEQSQIYYNFAMLETVVNQHAAVLNVHSKALADANDPNDH